MEEVISIEKYTEEERQFFVEQIQSMYNELYRILLVKTSSDQVAEELIQKICYKAWKSFHNLKDRSKFRGWIKMILDYTVKDYWREYYQEKEVMDITPDPENHIRKKSVRHSYMTSSLVIMKEMCGSLIRRENREMVCQALLQMKQPYQDLLKLYLYEEMSYKEIAELTGIKEGTVQVQIYRGLKKLAELYHKIDEEGSE